MDGFEPTTYGTTNRRSNRLSYIQPGRREAPLGARRPVGGGRPLVRPRPPHATRKEAPAPGKLSHGGPGRADPRSGGPSRTHPALAATDGWAPHGWGGHTEALRLKRPLPAPHGRGAGEGPGARPGRGRVPPAPRWGREGCLALGRDPRAAAGQGQDGRLPVRRAGVRSECAHRSPPSRRRVARRTPPKAGEPPEASRAPARRGSADHLRPASTPPPPTARRPDRTSPWALRPQGPGPGSPRPGAPNPQRRGPLVPLAPPPWGGATLDPPGDGRGVGAAKGRLRLSRALRDGRGTDAPRVVTSSTRTSVVPVASPSGPRDRSAHPPGPPPREGEGPGPEGSSPWATPED